MNKQIWVCRDCGKFGSTSSSGYVDGSGEKHYQHDVWFYDQPIGQRALKDISENCGEYEQTP